MQSSITSCTTWVPSNPKRPNSKDIIISKESPTASTLSVVEKNIILGEYPNSVGRNQLFKKTDTEQDSWINYVIVAIQNGRDPYRQNKSRVKTLSQSQLHYHAQRESLLETKKQ